MHEQVQPVPLVAERATQVGEEPDDALLALVVLHERMEDADLAGGAVVDHRAVEQGDDRVGIREALPVLREDRLGSRVRQRERVLVRDEDLDSVSPQASGAVVDERPLVGSEERPRKVDPHRLTLSSGRWLRERERNNVSR